MCKHRKDDSSDPSSSDDSDSSDESHYRHKRRKDKKHWKKDPIRIPATLTEIFPLFSILPGGLLIELSIFYLEESYPEMCA